LRRKGIVELAIDAHDIFHRRTAEPLCPRFAGVTQDKARVFGVKHPIWGDGACDQFGGVASARDELTHTHAGRQAKKSEKLCWAPSRVDQPVGVGSVRSTNDG
jgi:hypothetical protein